MMTVSTLVTEFRLHINYNFERKSDMRSRICWKFITISEVDIANHSVDKMTAQHISKWMRMTDSIYSSHCLSIKSLTHNSISHFHYWGLTCDWEEKWKISAWTERVNKISMTETFLFHFISYSVISHLINAL